MPRHTFREQSKAEGDREIFREQESFDAAMVTGPPASVIPENAVAWLYNCVAHQRWIQGRYGTVDTEAVLPNLPGRSGLSGTRVERKITSSDAAFTQEDVGNYWVWDDGENDEIIEYLSATQVRVDNRGDKTGDSCAIGGKLNGWYFHKSLKAVIFLLGRHFWVANDLSFSGFTRLQCISYDEPFNAVSDFDEFDDESVIVFNSNGMYKVFLDQNRYYRMNTPRPPRYITSNERADLLPYGRRYVYSVSRLSQDFILRDRATYDVLIEQESGPNALDGDLKDYGEVWTTLPRGDNSKTHGVATSGETVVASRDAVGVWSGVTDGSMIISMNGRLFTIYVDFTGVQTMPEVARRIEEVLRVYWPNATCVYGSIASPDRFIMTSGTVDGTTLDSVAAAGAGTNIYAAGYTNFINGTVENNVVYAEPHTIGLLQVPVIGTSALPQYHWTHYSIYGTLDIGVNGVDPVLGEGNDPERYVWLYDLRIAGAFYGSRTESGIITASAGQFEESDVGSVIEWWDGERDTILQYLSGTSVLVDSASGSYPEAARTGAFAIGDGTVMEASQTGNLVTRTAGGFFTADDVNKTLFWSNGYRSYITEFVSSTQVRVADTVDKLSQGMTFDPTQRYFHDRIDDDVLRWRTKSYTIKNRTWQPMPLTNMGRAVPGWIFSAVRGQSKFYYGQFAPATKYLAGYHNALQESDEIKDGIYSIQEYPTRIIFFCGGSVYGGPTNTSIPLEVPGTGEFINVFSGLQIVNSSVGVLDFGSITDIDRGLQFVITNEPAARIFDGYKFGENLAETEEGHELVMEYLRDWAKATATGFKDGELFVWGQQ